MATQLDDLSLLQRRTIQKFPPPDGAGTHFLISLAGIADEIAPWGVMPETRDLQLRELIPNEPWLASTIGSLAARNGAFSWTIEAGPRVAERLQEMLHLSNFGEGWISLISKVSWDLYTQDNGAFIEVIRQGDSPTSPLLNLAHLDSGKCKRTGHPEFPVIYTDREGGQHKLRPHEVIMLTDMPSPVQSMNGIGFCAVSRVLRAAQIMRGIMTRDHEKITGRFAGVLHIISGVNMAMIDDAFLKAQEQSDAKGRERYQPPIIAGTLDPAAQVKKETIDLASVPENYDQDTAMRWHIALMALAFLVEYQDLAPLSAGSLGTSQQSKTLHLKSKGKGPEHFQKKIEHALNFEVFPEGATFKFTEHDLMMEEIQAKVKKARAEARAIDVGSGVLTPQVGRQIMEDDGDLKDEYLEMLDEQDRTDETRATDETRLEDDELSETPGQESERLETDARVEDDETQKALSEADYWGRQRIKLEREAQEEYEKVLESIGRRVIKRVRQSIAEQV